MKVSEIRLLHNKIYLKEPYDLSFVKIRYVDSIVVQVIFDNNIVGFGEAVPLPGYSEETSESLIADIGDIASRIIGMVANDIVTFVSTALPNSPFARSALCVAKEMALGEIILSSNISIPLVAPMSSSMKQEDTLYKMHTLIDSGYKTLKLKVGRDIEADVCTVQNMLNELKGGIKIRVDANQAYSDEDARRLLDVLHNHHNFSLIEVIEQPFGISEWEKFALLVAEYPQAPLMLDESIFDLDDLEKAVSVGAKLVKLKLYKHKGTKEVMSLASKANELGLGVVLGNGVSTDFGNVIEALLYDTGLFMGAFEGNGFEKLVKCVLKNPPQSQHGIMKWISTIEQNVDRLQLGEGYSVIGIWGQKQ
jgi:L-Ala-D/L-Glu epimerase